MKIYFAAPILLALASCGTPQEQCIRTVSHDMIVLDRLIAETQGNLTRGYGYADTVVNQPEFVDCSPLATEANPNPRPQMCMDDRPVTVTRPVAVDLGAEQAKLTSMLKRRTEMAKALSPAVADCRARYPQ